MRIHRIGLVVGLLLMAQLAGTSCILFPTIVKRRVNLVVARIATVPLHATGATNSFTGNNTVNLRDSIDLAQAVSDAGIDIENVDKIVVGKVQYRVVVADLTAGRQITAGNVKVAAGGGALTDLIVGFSHAADAPTVWLTAGLNSAGVTQLNQMLASILAELKGGASADEHIGYSVTGTSAPPTTPTDFWYEIRVTLLISGKIDTKVLN